MTDFSGYLRSISAAYEKWWQCYTLTDLETDRATASPFGFELMVETVTRTGRDGEEKRDRFPVLQGLHDYVARETQVLLVGRPGSGKSTVLARVLLGKASSEEKERIPVLVELRSWKTSVLDLIRDFFQRHNRPLTTDQVRKLLADDRLFLLVDGLNELPSDAARQDVETLRNYRRVPMIFTTRDLSLGGDFGIQRQLQMQPLTEPQMQSLIRAYVRPDQADAMWRQITEGLRKFAETPLLLWMLCELFNANKTIPKNLGEVFRKFTQNYESSSIRNYEVMARKGNVQPLSNFRLWSTALKHLAAVMMRGEKPVDFRTVISRDEATRELMVLFGSSIELAANCVADLEKYHLLQVRSGNDLEFHHQLFQEYYAAEWLLERVGGMGDGELKRGFLNFLKWTEPVALMLALVEGKALAVRVVRLGLEVDLMLGARLAGEVKPQFQAKTVGFIEVLEVSEWYKVELLGRTRSDSAISLLLKFVEDSDSHRRREAVYALSKIGSTAIPSLLKLIEDSKSGVRADAAEVLGNIGSVEVIPALLKLFEDSGSCVSECAAEALANIGSVEVIPTLLKLVEDSNSFVRQSAAYVLGNIGSVEVIPALLKLIEDPDLCVRMNTADALGNIGSVEVIPALLGFTEDPEHHVRWRAAEALGKVGTAEVIPALLRFTKDPESLVRRKAAEALGNIGSVEAIPALLKLIEDPEPDGHWSAAEALGKIGTAEVILALLKLVEGSKSYVRKSATKALGDIDSVEVISALLKLMEDSEPYVRKSAIEALSRRGIAEAVPALIKLTEDSDINVCIDAVEALSEMGAVEAIPALIKLSENPGFFVLEKVARILGNIGTSAANEIAPHLHRYYALPPTKLGILEYLAILAVQAAYKFYNYEIWQAYLTAQQTDLASQNHDRPLTIQQNFNGPVGTVVGNVEGNQITPPANSVD